MEKKSEKILTEKKNKKEGCVALLAFDQSKKRTKKLVECVVGFSEKILTSKSVRKTLKIHHHFDI